MRFNPIVQLSLARWRELIREPEAVFWIFIFPVLLAVALGIAFRASGPEVVRVGVAEGQGAEWVRAALDADEATSARILAPEAAREELRTGRVVLVVVPGDSWTFWYDPSRPESRLARLAVDDVLQRHAGRTDVRAVAERKMTEKGSRYIDFLIPGLLGMNLMGTGMWGIGFNIVSSRQKRMLKRLVATPMRRSHYLLSQLAGRLVFLILEVGVLVAVARLFFDVPVRGSWFALSVVSVLGAMTFAGFGLLVASRAKTIEGVSGLMNFTMLPMWVMSGVFFSTARFPDVMQPLIQALPLTAVNDALRAVMIDGATLLAVGGDLAIAAAWCMGTFVTALALFRWN